MSISFSETPYPTLTVSGQTFTGISMLEVLDKVLREPESSLNSEPDHLEEMYQRIAMYHRHPSVPTLGFKLCCAEAVLPTKRIIDVGFDLTIIGVAKEVSAKTTLFETSVALDIPLGYYVELVPRSSLSKTGYMLANSVGIIDPGYTGTVKVPLVKVDDSMADLVLPAKVAQLILKPYIYSHSREVQQIASTTRDAGGFGSTDVELCDLSCNLICNESNGLCTHAYNQYT